MKTIRFGVFETNSSSCHSVTILSDAEYNAFKEQKAIIKDGGYRELTKEEIESDVTNDINYWKGSIERDGKTIELYEDLIKIECHKTFFEKIEKYKDDHWELRRVVDTTYDSAIAFLSEKIYFYKKSIEEHKETVSGLENADLDKVTKLTQEYAKDHRDFECLEREDFDCSDVEFDIIEGFLSCAWTYESFGGNYENTDESSRTIDGVTVHVLSYSGYDG